MSTPPQLRTIDLREIAEPPTPVRCSMDETKLEELAASIRLHGLLQPIIVVSECPGCEGDSVIAGAAPAEARAHMGPLYRIVAGHRRFLACRMIGLSDMPCMVYADGQLAEEAAMLAENVCRENITPAEEGIFFAQYVEKHGPLEADLPRIFGKSLNYIYERMAFVAGPPDIVEANAARKINFAVAKELMKVTDEQHRKWLLGHAIEGGATARVVMGWVLDWRKMQCGPAQPPAGEPVAMPVAALPLAEAPCIYCGELTDRGRMVQAPIHDYEIAPLVRMLTQMGLRKQ
jgi:ParB family transcriptional regulator, chromosome partitioning protein